MSKFSGLISKAENKAEPEKTEKEAPKAKNIKGRSPGKRSDPNYAQVTAYIKKDLHGNVMREIYRKQEFSQLVEDLLLNWLKTQKSGKPKT